MKARTQRRKQSRKKRPGRSEGLRAPRTEAQFSALPADAQETWNRMLHVVSKMRADGVSLRAASREFGVHPRIVLRLGRSALRKRTNGQYVAKPTDRLLRVLVIPTPKGLREIALRDSREAAKLGEYWAAVQKYLQTGDASALQKVRGKTITNARRKRHRLVTDLADLDRLGSAGVLSFESLYARVA